MCMPGALHTGTFLCSRSTHLIRSISVSGDGRSIRFVMGTEHPLNIDGFKGWGKLILRDGWKCQSVGTLTTTVVPDATSSSDFILACCDVEGNFLVVKAYQYTTLLSCMLLDWSVLCEEWHEKQTH